eukprot:TRINITY_DN28357_c1_g3_i1.p2 TRINITY_DN28357_c1_g3~~TRINITY_DN28357_c1_g3_i1.p2  ORF type:complete len:295 (+),score=140.82 TRINITY_DN28357_c1_g3_i1:69-887(+)
MPDTRLFADGSSWSCNGPSDAAAAARRELARLEQSGGEPRAPREAARPPAAAPGSPLRSLGGCVAGRPVPLAEEVLTLCTRSELAKLEAEQRSSDAAAARYTRDIAERAVLEQDAGLAAQGIAAAERDERLWIETAGADSWHASGLRERARLQQEGELAEALEHLKELEEWRVGEGHREAVEQARAKVMLEFEEADQRLAAQQEKERMHKLAVERLFMSDELFIMQEQETERIRRLLTTRRDNDAEAEERARMRQIRIGMRGFHQGYAQMSY